MADEVDWISDRRELAAHEDEWRALALQPFGTPEYMMPWLEAFATESALRACCVRRDNRLVALLPLVEHDRRLIAAANEHSGSFAPLAADDAARAAAIDAAIEAAGGVLRLPGVPVGDPVLEASQTPWRVILTEDQVSPAVDTTGSLEQWRAESKPRWGAPLERFRRKMQRDHEARFVSVERPDDLAATLDAGFAVEASGWKGRVGTAILSTPATALFYRRVAERFDSRDALRISSIELDGELVAFDLYLLHDRRLHLLKTGFHEGFRKLAPGLVMQLNTVERCFQLGLQSYELLGHRSEWKAKFATVERPHVSWTGYSRRPRATARYAYRRGGRLAKRTGRTVAGRIAAATTARRAQR